MMGFHDLHLWASPKPRQTASVLEVSSQSFTVVSKRSKGQGTGGKRALPCLDEKKRSSVVAAVRSKDGWFDQVGIEEKKK